MRNRTIFLHCTHPGTHTPPGHTGRPLGAPTPSMPLLFAIVMRRIWGGVAPFGGVTVSTADRLCPPTALPTVCPHWALLTAL